MGIVTLAIIEPQRIYQIIYFQVNQANQQLLVIIDRHFPINDGIDSKALWKDEVESGKKSKVFLPGNKNFGLKINYVLVLIDRSDIRNGIWVKSYAFIQNFKNSSSKIYDDLLENLKY